MPEPSDVSQTKTPLVKKRRLDVLKDEWTSFVFSFCWFCMLMSGYYILRPIRESLGSALGSGELKWLFLYTFFTTLVIVPAFSKLVAIMQRRTLINIVFHFLIMNILVFAFFVWRDGTTSNLLLARVYFVWVTVFGLFAVSVFWSVLTDLFSNEQGKRLFGPIASGASTGAIVGSLIASNFAERIGLAGLLCVAAAMIEIGLIFAWLLQRSARKWEHLRAPKQAINRDGGTWAGLIEIGRSRYLISICGYLALISVCGTTIYLQLADAAGSAFESDEIRTSYFANINFAVQVGTFVAQIILVGQIMQRLGLSVALVILPIVYLICFLLLGLSSSFALLGIIEVVRRIAVYGITSPAREVLFTVVSRDAKYKSKNFMDTVVIRGTDSLTSAVFVQLKTLLGSVATISWIMLPLTLVWISIGWSLGKQQRVRAQSETGIKN
jgi:AAA family ATP:ADP antiporter